MDLSALRKFEVAGTASEALLQYTLTRDVKKLGIGQVVYTAMCCEHGSMINDGTLCVSGKTICFGSAATTIPAFSCARLPKNSASRCCLLFDRPDTQHRGPRSQQLQYPERNRLDATAPAGNVGTQMVPLHHMPHWQCARRTGAGIAHRPYRKTRLRDLVSSVRCRDCLRRCIGEQDSRMGSSRWALARLTYCASMQA